MFNALLRCFLELWSCFVRKRIKRAQCDQAGKKEANMANLLPYYNNKEIYINTDC